MNNNDIWAQIAAPVPVDVVQWRQNGKPKARDGKFYAPFVAYIDAQFVRERLDSIVPGEWDLNLELLPAISVDANGEVSDEPVALKARLSILGVHREDIGAGKDYKTASTDAFKRAAVRFGIGHELYTDYEIVWVQVDSDSKFARAVEEPAQAWIRKANRTPQAPQVAPVGNGAKAAPASPSPTSAASLTSSPSDGPLPEQSASCPKCGGGMFDNRLSKRNPKAPDYKCRSRSCDGVIWPPKGDAAPERPSAPRAEVQEYAPLADEPDGLPFR